MLGKHLRPPTIISRVLKVKYDTTFTSRIVMPTVTPIANGNNINEKDLTSVYRTIIPNAIHINIEGAMIRKQENFKLY